ncbi:hypothetical protein GCK32_018992, partial [Trichostrongylus colubriformis]
VVSSRETTPSNGLNGATSGRRKKHSRGSSARHTLGVDVQWLKRLVTKKDEPEQIQPTITPTNDERISFTAVGGTERVSLRQRLPRLLNGEHKGLIRSSVSVNTIESSVDLLDSSTHPVDDWN